AGRFRRVGAAAGRHDRRIEDDPRAADASQRSHAAVRGADKDRAGGDEGASGSLAEFGAARTAHPPGHPRHCGWEEPMTLGRAIGVVFVIVVVFAQVGTAADVKTRGDFAGKASWTMPSVDAVREQSLSWLAERPIDEASKAQIAMLWSSAALDANDAHLLDL